MDSPIKSNQDLESLKLIKTTLPLDQDMSCKDLPGNSTDGLVAAGALNPLSRDYTNLSPNQALNSVSTNSETVSKKSGTWACKFCVAKRNL